MSSPSLADRMNKLTKKNNKYSAKMSKVKPKDVVSVGVPMLNVALNGRIDGGFEEGGTHQIVGESKCFKTCYGLIQMAAYLNTYPEAVAFYFDSEGGATKRYMEAYGVDQDRVFHLPLKNIEDLRSQMYQYLDDIQPGEKAFFFIDSLGLLASKKEQEDALSESDKADMTRAKVITSFWRIVTNEIKVKRLYSVVINHFYETMEMHSKPIVKGGKASEWAPDDTWMVTRSKIKEGKDLAGHSFNIKVLKSRNVREGARIPIEVTFEGGINRYSGLLEVARATGHVELVSGAWYTRPGVEDDKKWRRGAVDSEEFWAPVLADPSFLTAVENAYTLNSSNMTARLDAIMNEEYGESENVKVDEETGEILI